MTAEKTDPGRGATVLFQEQVFRPEAIADPRLRRALDAVAAHPAEVLHPADVLAAILHGGNDPVQSLLAQAVRPGFTLLDALATPVGSPAADPARPRTVANFA